MARTMGVSLLAVDVPSPRTKPSAPNSADLLKRDPAGVLQYVRRTVMRTCPARLMNKAEDIVQAVMLRVLEIQQQQGEIRTTTYLSRAAYSVLVDEIRRQLKRPESSLEALEAEALERSSATHGRPPDDLGDLG